jgi:hypothetical protein
MTIRVRTSAGSPRSAATAATASSRVFWVIAASPSPVEVAGLADRVAVSEQHHRLLPGRDGLDNRAGQPRLGHRPRQRGPGTPAIHRSRHDVSVVLVGPVGHVSLRVWHAGGPTRPVTLDRADRLTGRALPRTTLPRPGESPSPRRDPCPARGLSPARCYASQGLRRTSGVAVHMRPRPRVLPAPRRPRSSRTPA